jgi:hypothetical protein
MSTTVKWNLTGNYFESCNCAVVCPCLVSTAAPLTSRPTEGDCHFAMAFHIDKGTYEGVKLDGLNVVLIGESHGPMGNGNITGAAYIDERADNRQTEALGAIFGGTVGGPMGALAPLFGKNLGMKKVKIAYRSEGAKRSAEIPQVLKIEVKPLPHITEGEVMWAATGHPVNPTKLALASTEKGSSYTDYGYHWDNSGKNAHYAEIAWSN